MSGFATRGHDPIADRAAALIRELDSHKSSEPQFAEPMHRLIARILDLGAWMAIGLALSIAAFYADVWFFDDPLGPPGLLGEPPTPIARTEPVVSWVAFVGLFVSIYAYECIPTAIWGRHPAKRRLRLRVVGPDGRPPGMRRATVRWATWAIPAVGGFVAWGATFGSQWGFLAIAVQFAGLTVLGSVFFNEHHRGWHDRLAGTTVLADR